MPLHCVLVLSATALFHYCRVLDSNVNAGQEDQWDKGTHDQDGRC
jgi:hypothetical protein